MKKLFSGSILLLATTVLTMTACSSSDDTVPENITNLEWYDTGIDDSFDPSYKNYIGTSDFTTDFGHFLELAIAIQDYKNTMFLAYLSDSKEAFAGDISAEELQVLTKKEAEINTKYEQYQASVERMMASNILDTQSPDATRGILGAAWGSVKFFFTMKNTGENSRKTMLGVLAQNPEGGREIFNSLSDNWKQGETSYENWIQKMNEGKYDKIASAMYSEVYNTSQSLWVDGGAGGSLWEYANDHKVRPTDNLNRAAPELWASGANLATAVISTRSSLPGMGPKDIANAVAGSTAAREGLVIAGGVTTGAAATSWTSKILSKTDKTQSEKEREALEKELEKASERYIKQLQNEGNKKTTIDVNDSDSESPAENVVAVDEDGNITAGVGGTSVPITIDGEKEVNVTAVDKNGDKFTKEITAKPDQKNTVDGSSDEKEKIAGKPYANVDQTALKFTCDKSSQTINIDTNYKYYRARKANKEAGWVSVTRSGKVVTVTVEDNDEDDARSTNITIEFSKDKESIAHTITIPVTQEGWEYDGDGLVFDLSFVDLTTFTIDGITAYCDEHCVTEATNGWGAGAKKVTLSTSDLQFTKESDQVYLVTGKYKNILSPSDFGDGASPNSKQAYRFDRPYGYYIDISFRIEVVPFRDANFVDENDPAKGIIWSKIDMMKAKDLKISGYYKQLVDCSYGWYKVTGYDKDKKYTYRHVKDWYDRYVEFSIDCAEDTQDGFVEEQNGRHVFVAEGYFKPTTYSYEEHYITKTMVQVGDEAAGNYRGDPEFEYQEVKNSDTKNDRGVTMTLSWK